MTTPPRIAIALTRMTAEPWREAISEACAELGIAVDVQLWNGAALHARYAAVWLPPAVGVLGLGAMGAQIACAAASFGYSVRGWSRTARRIDGVSCFAGDAELGKFLAQTHILVNALPLTAETRDLLNRARLSQLPQGAHLINVGRGGTIVDADLLALLDAGHLAGAVLDVFRTEPLPDEHPFWRHPKVTVTPHLAGPTPRGPAAKQIAEAIALLERGAAPESLPGFVDRARGY